jgi:uncharacterized protein YifN (PemK superfamily)
MPIRFTPSRGQILLCDFEMAWVPPEMRKKRRVVVVSNRSHNSAGRLIVVPFSATPPAKPTPTQVHVSAASYESFGFDAVCDCIAHVSFRRLDRVFHGGRFIVEALSAADIQRVEEGLKHAIGLLEG